MCGGPVYWGGGWSNSVYRLSNVRKALGVRVNIEMLYLVDEMFRQGGSDFEIVIGEPIPCDRLLARGRTPLQATQMVRERAYALREAVGRRA